MENACLESFSPTQQKSENIPKLSTSGSQIIIRVGRTEGLLRPPPSLSVCGCASGKNLKQLKCLCNRDYTSIRAGELALLVGRQRKRSHPKMLKVREPSAG